MSDFTIRSERPSDHEQIEGVVRAAFARHPDEVASFVDRIRASEQYCPELALVAEDSSGVIGHVMLSWIGLDGSPAGRLLVLTPMSVRPDRQGRGVGTALIAEVLRRAEESDEPAVLVEGIPAYYRRFGFEPAGPLGFVKPSEQIPDAAFMVKRLRSYTPEVAGQVVYPPSYDALAPA